MHLILIMFDIGIIQYLIAGTVFYVLGFLYALGVQCWGKSHNAYLFYGLITIGFAMQSFGLYRQGLRTHSFPLHNTFEILMVMAWSAVMLELFIRPIFRLPMLGFFISFLASVLGGVALLFFDLSAAIPEPAETGNPWVGFHAALAVFSYGIFGLLAVTSAMYLLQHFSLRGRHTAGLFRNLPPLKRLDDLNKRLLMGGVSILTLSIAIGMANWAHHPESVGATKLFVALGVWVLYMAVHRLRHRNTLLASGFAWACIASFGVALVTMGPLTREEVPVEPSPPSASAATPRETRIS